MKVIITFIGRPKIECRVRYWPVTEKDGQTSSQTTTATSPAEPGNQTSLTTSSQTTTTKSSARSDGQTSLTTSSFTTTTTSATRLDGKLIVTVSWIIFMAALRSRCGHYIFVLFLLMAALRNRGHYIFVLWFLLYGRPMEYDRPLYFCPVVSFFLSIFFSSPNLSSRRLDVYHTSTHDVALVRI